MNGQKYVKDTDLEVRMQVSTMYAGDTFSGINRH